MGARLLQVSGCATILGVSDIYWLAERTRRLMAEGHSRFDAVKLAADVDGGLPTLLELLYVGPNPDGSRKKCGNCWKWAMDQRCLEVEGEIKEGQVCSLHIYGKPQDKMVDMGQALLSRARAGLIETPEGEGTSCDNCKYYQAEESLCRRAREPDSPDPGTKVDPKGCCNGWDQ